MEFIPIERYSVKNKEKKPAKKDVETTKKVKKNETDEEVVNKKTKFKPQTKVVNKKNVKNKYKETLALKQKEKLQRKKTQKAEDEEEQEEEDDEGELLIDKINNEEEEEEEEEEGSEEEEENEDEEDEEDESNPEVKAFKKKCKEMDEKKKNRLFVKLKKKIHSEGEIKELHPDIRQVIFPRKKNSRWCWAVFASEERANGAMKQLVKNKDIFVSKPNPYDRVNKKLKEKMKTVLLKKETKKKLQKMWM